MSGMIHDRQGICETVSSLYIIYLQEEKLILSIKDLLILYGQKKMPFSFENTKACYDN